MSIDVTKLADLFGITAAVLALLNRQSELVDDIIKGMTPEQRATLDGRLAASREAKEELRRQLDLHVDVVPDPPS